MQQPCVFLPDHIPKRRDIFFLYARENVLHPIHTFIPNLQMCAKEPTYRYKEFCNSHKWHSNVCSLLHRRSMAHFEHDSLISLVLKNGSHHGQLADSARFPSLDAPDLDLVGNVRPTPKTWPKAGEHLLFSMLPCLPPPHKEIHSCPEAGRSGPLGIMRTFSESHLFLPGFHFDGSEHLNSKTGKSSALATHCSPSHLQHPGLVWFWN
uniref:Uncharacterized protein n=1 Tax=Trieres chinensis TaxID=1514140 RepID=A0A7S2A759_TRICV|mmetsp:Transcript_5628/g.11752  ORF Transcript_5628/g.11752 Transcript_5628/m.11752 type:complete len:208 (+) Transcript_5628:469-1092(+)